LLDRNHGHDISKYFHGGYANESSKVSISGHKHSNYAVEIVKTLIVARLSDKKEVNWVTVEKSELPVQKMGQHVSQFEFKGNGITEMLKGAYNDSKRDISMVGRHLLVKDGRPGKQNIDKVRQYSLAFCMEKGVY
jgi:hypothetical protein